jgi:RNA polymerase sigma-70 factor (ECF subfamily)
VSANGTAQDETRSLVARACAGDRRAAEALIGRYQQRVARFVVVQTGNDGAYEDLCQTVFVKMVLGLPRLRAAERFEPWLFQIARNVCRDHLRKQRGWRRLFVSYGAEHDRIGAAEPDAEIGEGLERHLNRLSEAQRSLLALSLDGRRSYGELARLTHVSVSAVKSRLHRARERLKSLMLAEDPE